MLLLLGQGVHGVPVLEGTRHRQLLTKVDQSSDPPVGQIQTTRAHRDVQLVSVERGGAGGGGVSCPGLEESQE